MAKLNIGDEVHVLGTVAQSADSNDESFYIEFRNDFGMYISATKIIKHIPKALTVGEKIKLHDNDFIYDVLWTDKESVLLRRHDFKVNNKPIIPFIVELCNLKYERV